MVLMNIGSVVFFKQIFSHDATREPEARYRSTCSGRRFPRRENALRAALEKSFFQVFMLLVF